MNKGIIFDVDGTILDSMNIWLDAGKYIWISLELRKKKILQRFYLI